MHVHTDRLERWHDGNYPMTPSVSPSTLRYAALTTCTNYLHYPIDGPRCLEDEERNWAGGERDGAQALPTPTPKSAEAAVRLGL